MSQIDAAGKIGFSRAAISRWEAGTREADEQVTQRYIEEFQPTSAEVKALLTGELDNPLALIGADQLESVLVRLRADRLQGQHASLDLEYLAIDAALNRQNRVGRMALYDSYIERLEWEYRHREAYIWAQRNLQLAHEAQDYNYIGRAVRATSHQLITEMRKTEEGLRFLSAAAKLARGSSSQRIVTRECADRLAQAGRMNEVESVLSPIPGVPGPRTWQEDPTGFRFLQASLANSAGHFGAALNMLAEATHPDPYMKSYLVQLEAEARHALGDIGGCQRVLEDAIRALDRPGLKHFSDGLVERMKMAGRHTYSPELWRWRRSGMSRHSCSPGI